jgi:hypothetical protein
MNNDEFKTETRTYRFFSKDIVFMVQSGYTPKSIFNMGCKAIRDNPQLINRIRELEDGNTKLQKKLTTLSILLNKRLDEKN